MSPEPHAYQKAPGNEEQKASSSLQTLSSGTDLRLFAQHVVGQGQNPVICINAPALAEVSPLFMESSLTCRPSSGPGLSFVFPATWC